MLSEYAKAGTRIRPKSARATVGAYYMPAKTPLQLQPPNVQEMLMRQQHRLQMHLQRDARRKAESELTARQAAESEAARIRADIVRELEEKREREEAAELAKAVSAMGSRSMINAPVATQVLQPPPVNPHKYAHVTDAQLRNTHAIMKGRLEQLYGGVLSYIRKAFLYLDKDNTGTITPDELVDGMLSLNVNVPRHLLEHLINVCDYDRDGEIGYPEFARILQADDIVDIKAAGAEEEGLILKQPPKQYRNGITVEQMLTAHRQLKEFLTAENSRFRAIFRKMDEDKNGWADREEMRLLPMFCGLEALIRKEVMEEIIDFMDIDGDGRILYNEFVKVIMADDVTEFFH